ncbi:hypothetical protein WH52_07185 [Tenacibaculum holothuriorum]|uniref:DZANK-type domain-containing protein n=1 Tax=Tenacibaculum holothuriorum TaxID=1635173 RepID=A0A1Y2PDF8_9FLAO|nr:zinc ribbon domain-containing protein [Tenacibaculum holothuriorum]OSY88526.1 hypothetical protein WH52_07185 [Tenacibaculum holothuriorum]
MKNCPNCNFEVKDSYKFCPSCKISFDKFKPKENKSSFCTDCGTKVSPDFKFCKNCGKEIPIDKSENKIDKSIGKVKTGISVIQKEVSNSKTVENITKNTKEIAKETTKKVNTIGNKLLKFSGIVGIIILVIMILSPMITENDFVIETAYNRHLKNRFSISKFFSGFIAELIAPIILPIVFIYLGFKKNNDVKGCLLLPIIICLIGFTIMLFMK